MIRPALEQRGVAWSRVTARRHVLGLWSPLFLDSGSAGPVSWEAIGFPRPAPAKELELPEQVEAFLSAGPPPVVFSFGSHVKSIGIDRVLRLARDVVDRLGCPAIVTTLEDGASPPAATLPDSLLPIPFVNLDALLPRARVLVHHGGIGTTACALRAGVPSVIAPMVFDQPFNARCCAGLGAGLVIKPVTRVDHATVAEAIETASGAAYREASQRISRTVCTEDGLSAAVSRIEQLP